MENTKQIDRGAPEPWIGVDLDGTLAYYDEWENAWTIGAPIPAMVKRVRVWLREGRNVRILTARVSHNCTSEQMLDSQRAMIAIMDWCERHIGQALPVTCSKDYGMVELWDDRVVQVDRNTGTPIGVSTMRPLR